MIGGDLSHTLTLHMQIAQAVLEAYDSGDLTAALASGHDGYKVRFVGGGEGAGTDALGLPAAFVHGSGCCFDLVAGFLQALSRWCILRVLQAASAPSVQQRTLPPPATLLRRRSG